MINNDINPIINELKNFLNNNNIGHINTANNQTDSLITHLSNIPAIAIIRDNREAIETISSFRKSAGQHIKNIELDYQNLKNNFNEIKNKFSEFGEEIKSQKGRLDNAISQFQKQFSDSENSRRDEFSKSEQKRLDKFNSISNELKEKIDEILKLTKEKSDSLINSFTIDSKKVIDNLTKKTEDLISFITERKNESEKLLNIIANTGMAGGYQKVANQARATKNFWHVVALLGIIGLIVFAIIAFNSTINETFNIGKFGARTFVAFSFALLAAYAARQAEKNSSIERKNRQLELELASINPYLSKLPEEKQIEIKRLLAEKWFGNDIIEKEIKAVDKYSGNVFDLLKIVIENLTKK